MRYALPTRVADKGWQEWITGAPLVPDQGEKPAHFHRELVKWIESAPSPATLTVSEARELRLDLLEYASSLNQSMKSQVDLGLAALAASSLAFVGTILAGPVAIGAAAFSVGVAIYATHSARAERRRQRVFDEVERKLRELSRYIRK